MVAAAALFVGALLSLLRAARSGGEGTSSVTKLVIPPPTVTGYMCGVACWKRKDHIAHDGAPMRTNPERHGVACMREMKNLCDTGFYILQRAAGVSTYAPTVELDGAGLKQALALLGSTSATNDLMVTLRSVEATGNYSADGVPVVRIASLGESSAEERQAALANGTALSCPSLASANVKSLHGWWMTLSWSTVSVIGVYIARYCRAHPWWIDWHIRLEATGSFGAVAFVGVGIAAATGQQQASGHQLLGALIGLYTFFMVWSGSFIYSWCPKDAFGGAEWGPQGYELLRLVHIKGSKLLLVLAFIEIVNGFWLIEMRWELQWAWYAWLLLLCGVFAIAEYRLRHPSDADQEQSTVGGTGYAEETGKNHKEASCCTFFFFSKQVDASNYQRNAASAFFRSIDVDGDGELGFEEFVAVVGGESQWGYELTQEQLALAFAKLDADNSGTISMTEFNEWWDNNPRKRFMSLCASPAERQRLEWAATAFREADLDGGGTICRAEFDGLFERLRAEGVLRRGAAHQQQQEEEAVRTSETAAGKEAPPPALHVGVLDVEDVWRSLDGDSNGTVEFTEFLGWLVQQAHFKTATTTPEGGDDAAAGTDGGIGGNVATTAALHVPLPPADLVSPPRPAASARGVSVSGRADTRRHISSSADMTIQQPSLERRAEIARRAEAMYGLVNIRNITTI